jgi:hypothetical protein
LEDDASFTMPRFFDLGRMEKLPYDAKTCSDEPLHLVRFSGQHHNVEF